jgi:hypothetical protein
MSIIKNFCLEPKIQFNFNYDSFKMFPISFKSNINNQNFGEIMNLNYEQT